MSKKTYSDTENEFLALSEGEKESRGSEKRIV